MAVGRSGYVKNARAILQGASALRNGISEIDGLQVMGDDVTMVVAWRSIDKAVPIYVLNDVMTANGWHLSVLHAPPALHYCVTPANVRSVGKLVDDLQTACEKVKQMTKSGAAGVESGKAPIYGLAGGLPDRGLIGDILKDVQDLMLKNV